MENKQGEKDDAIKKDTNSAESQQQDVSGPYPAISPKASSSKKISGSKGRFSAIRSSLRRDVEGIKSTIRRTRNTIPEATADSGTVGDATMVRKSKKNKKLKSIIKNSDEKSTTESASTSKTASLVRRLSIGKYKTSIKEFDSAADQSSASATSSATPTSTKRNTSEGDDNRSMSETSFTEEHQSKMATSAEIEIKHDESKRENEIVDEQIEEKHADTEVSSNENDVANSKTLEEYLDQLTDNSNAPIQIAIVPPTNANSAVASPPLLADKSDKTESCDEDDERSEPGADTTSVGSSQENQSTTQPRNISSSMIEGAERREHLYKILVIGELGTGKTSIIKRYVHQFFSQHYRATIGVDFALKVLNWDANTIIRLQLWDIAGQERFGNMTRVYYKEAVGAFIVFDVTRVATFDAVVKWKQDLDCKVQLSDGSPIPCILLANKCDQQKEGLVNTPSRMDEYCKEKGFAGWYETSAKENINIEEAARSLVNKILLNDKLIHGNDAKRDNDVLALDGKNGNENEQHTSSGKTCAC